MQVLESLRMMLSARRTDAETIIITTVQAAADEKPFDLDALLAALTTKGQSLSDFERMVETEVARREALAQIAEANGLRTEIEAADKVLDKARATLAKAESAHKSAQTAFEAAYSESRRLSQIESTIRHRAEQKLSTLNSSN